MQNGTEFRATYSRYLNETMSDFSNLVDLVYSEQCYDATWALAYALNDTLTKCSMSDTSQTCFPGLTGNSPLGLQHFMYNNSQIHQKMRGHLEDTNFTGITVSFSKHVARNDFIRADSYQNTILRVKSRSIGLTEPAGWERQLC